MGLGLLVPAFLAGLVALATPIYLHLRHREKDRPQRFPSLMFLELLPIRTAERRRITDWPLLLLRALALAFLVMAFARPVFSRQAAVERAQRTRAVVVLLDRSLSMSRTGVWPAAVDTARRVLSSLGGTDRGALVLFDDAADVAQPFTTDRSVLLAALGKAVPSARGTRYAAALRAARQLVLRAGDAVPEVVIITDLQRSGVSGVAGLDLPKGLVVRTIAVGATSATNASVASVDIHRVAEPLRTMLSVDARLVSRDGAAPRTVRASLTLNGRVSGSKAVVLPATGDVRVVFDPVLLPAGRVRGTVSMDPDALAADDTFNFAFSSDDVVRVLLVAPDDAMGDETLFFERALAVGNTVAVRVERVRAGAMDARALGTAALVVLWDTPPPAGSAGIALAKYVEDGGGLVVAVNRRFGARGPASPLMPATVVGETDRLTDRGGAIGDVRFDHPLFSVFRSTPSTLGAARFLRYPRLEPLAGSDVLARFDDGLPAVIERRAGLGHVVLVGTPLDVRSGDFPLQSAYLPFLQRLVMYASGRDATSLARFTGQTWLLPGALTEPAVLTPQGAIVRPAKDSVGATVALRESGVYALYEGRVQGEPAALLAVNPPAGESDLTAMDARDLLLGVRESTVAASASSDVPTQTEVEGRQRLWRALLIVVALLLLTETCVANRGWRGTASRIGAAPDGRGS
ncbi:MAG: BatA domain-containing protein [bacterium]